MHDSVSPNGYVSLPISISTNGDNTVLAGLTAHNGQRIRVCGYILAAASAVSVTFKSGTAGGGSNTVLAGPIPLSAVPFASDYCEVGWFATKPAEDLNLFLSSGVAVTGHLLYQPVGGS